MTLIAWRFQRAEKPATLTGLAAAVGVPTRLAGQVLQALVDQKLLAEVAEAETAYVPLRPLAQITAHDILQTLRAGKGLDLSTREDSMRPLVHQSFENIALAERTAAANVNLQTMVDRLVQESSGTASSQPA
jgi:DNA-binding IscR family transcriptional regulator